MHFPPFGKDRLSVAVALGFLLPGCSATEHPQDDVAAALAAARLELDRRQPELASLGAEATIAHGVARHHPDVVAARSSLAAALARARGSDSAWSVDLETGVLTPVSSGADGTESHGELGFDVLGIAGVGRVPAAAVLAEREVLQAAAVVERTLFEATLEARRKALTLAALERGTSRFHALANDAQPSIARAEELFASGWIGDSAAGECRAVRDEALRRAFASGGAASRLRAALAIDIGTALDPSFGLDSLAPPTLPDPAPDLACHPALREAVSDLAVAEAKLRAAAAHAWPELRIGPAASYSADGGFAGGLLSVAFDDPRRIDAEVGAAEAERDFACHCVAHRVAALEAGAADARRRIAAGARTRELAASGLDRARSAAAAAEARFQADPALASEWARMFRDRLDAADRLFTADQDAIDAAVDLALALGSGSDPDPRSPEASP